MYPVLAQAGGAGQALAVVVALVVVFVVVVLMLIVYSYGFVWLRALLAGAHVGMLEIISMRLNGVRPAIIVDSRIMAVQAGLSVRASALEAHYLAGGNVLNVTRALIAASRAGIDLTLHEACAIDLAGHDVLEAVRSRIDAQLAGYSDPGGPGPGPAE